MLWYAHILQPHSHGITTYGHRYTHQLGCTLLAAFGWEQLLMDTFNALPSSPSASSSLEFATPINIILILLIFTNLKGNLLDHLSPQTESYIVKSINNGFTWNMLYLHVQDTKD